MILPTPQELEISYVEDIFEELGALSPTDKIKVLTTALLTQVSESENPEDVVKIIIEALNTGLQIIHEHEE